MSSGTTQQQQVKLLRGGSFVQPNTAAAPAAILQNETLHPEDLHALTRTSTIMLRPTILKWRSALDAVAEQLARETKQSVNLIRADHPGSIRIVDFKTPPPVTFMGLHRLDGKLNFQWQDRDAAVAGVYQPKIEVGNGNNEDKKNKNNNNNVDSKNTASSYLQRKLWQAHELEPTDKMAWELLRQHWRDVGKKVKEDLQQKMNQLGSTSATAATSTNDKNSVGVFVELKNNNNNIRQREKNDQEEEMTKPKNSADVTTTVVTSVQTKKEQVEDDLEAILRRAQEVLGL